MRAESTEPLTKMVGQLAADAKRLVVDEVRLAHLEIDEGARAAARGLAGIATALGVAAIAATATTVLFAILLGDLTGKLWAGCLITGAVELLAGALLYARGQKTLAAPMRSDKPVRRASA
ncbi:MAG: phage holin family protein [Gemmatimonadota bacterium]|nr:phage holin family protein [Gemmatimonadota bacterium]